MAAPRPRIGLTGHRGVLGTCLQRENSAVEWVNFPGDIRNYEEVRAWVQASLPLDGLLHLAAMVPVGKVEAQPQAAFQTNVGGACHILEAIRETVGASTCPWIFLGSTSHVYASSDQRLAEDAEIRPISLYGFTKWQAEELGMMYASKYQMPICLGRIFSYSSALQPSSYFIPSLIEKIKTSPQGATLEIPGLKGFRDFVSTRQINQAIEFLRQKRMVGPVNIGTGTAVRLMDIALTIRAKLGRDDIKIVALDAGTATLCANPSRLEAAGLRLEPEIDFLVDEVLAAKNKA